MITAEFNKLLNALTQLTDLQTKRLEKALKGENPAQIIINVLKQRLVTNPECPHCRSDRIKRNGKLNMMQRYRCNACSKTFNATTKTPLAKLHYKDKWLTYFSDMIEGDVLRKSALKCSMNLKTSFRWRHRLLELPALLKATSLQGIIEMDETFFAYSEKGSRSLSRPAKKRAEKAKKRGRSKQDWVAVMTARDRSKHTYEAVLSSVSSA
jgi:transposase-like protein